MLEGCRPGTRRRGEDLITLSILINKKIPPFRSVALGSYWERGLTNRYHLNWQWYLTVRHSECHIV